MSCHPEVDQVITGRTGIRRLDGQVWASRLQGVRCAADLGREARPPPMPPYLRVKCSTLGLEGEEELGAR